MNVIFMNETLNFFCKPASNGLNIISWENKKNPLSKVVSIKLFHLSHIQIVTWVTLKYEKNGTFVIPW